MLLINSTILLFPSPLSVCVHYKKLLKLYICMTEQLSKTGRELNATFVPGSLLRKTDNKMSNTLISKCTPQRMQMIFKRLWETPSSKSTLPSSSSQDTNWKSPIALS